VLQIPHGHWGHTAVPHAPVGEGRRLDGIGPLDLHPGASGGRPRPPSPRGADGWRAIPGPHPHLSPHAAHALGSDRLARLTPRCGHASHPGHGTARLRRSEPASQEPMVLRLVHRLVVHSGAVHVAHLTGPPPADLLGVRVNPWPSLRQGTIPLVCCARRARLGVGPSAGRVALATCRHPGPHALACWRRRPTTRP
jgi:hypothetical protein